MGSEIESPEVAALPPLEKLVFSALLTGFMCGRQSIRGGIRSEIPGGQATLIAVAQDMLHGHPLQLAQPLKGEYDAGAILWHFVARHIETWPRGFDPETDVRPENDDYMSWRGDMVAIPAIAALEAQNAGLLALLKILEDAMRAADRYILMQCEPCSAGETVHEQLQAAYNALNEWRPPAEGWTEKGKEWLAAGCPPIVPQQGVGEFPSYAVLEWAFCIGDRVRKVSGSSWRGKIVGYYSTQLTPRGYCVESENEPGSVQIYPERAIAALAGIGAGQEGEAKHG